MRGEDFVSSISMSVSIVLKTPVISGVFYCVVYFMQRLETGVLFFFVWLFPSFRPVSFLATS